MTLDELQQPGLRGSVEQRFWAKVAKSDDCWNWTGSISGRGYGRMQTPASSSSAAHRISYILHHGMIGDGMVVDHICRNKLCVNPAHLRAVTPKQNTLENSASVTAINAAKTHCAKGHPFSGDNLLAQPGERRCRQCQRGYDKARRRRNRSLAQSKGDE